MYVTVDPRCITPIVTVFNKSAEEITGCMNSLTRFPFFEIIVVNDCSTNPETNATLAKLKDVRVVDLKENAGPSGALSAGVMLLKSQYMMKIDADDKLLGLHAIHKNSANFDVCLTFVDKECYRPKDLRIPVTHEGVLFNPRPYIAGAIIKTDIAKKVFKRYKLRALDDLIGYLRILDHTDNIVVSENIVYEYNTSSKTSLSKAEVIGEYGFSDFNVMMAFFAYLYENEDVKLINRKDLELLYEKNKFVFTRIANLMGYNYEGPIA